MIRDVLFPPRVLIILAGLFSAFFILASSPLFLPTHLSNAHAQGLEQRLTQLKAQIDFLVKKGTFVPALTKAKLYVSLTEKKYGNRHPNFARALQLQAKIYRHLRRPYIARKLDQRAAAVLKNYQNFRIKRSANLDAARNQAKKRLNKQRALMLRRKRAQQEALLKRRRAAQSIQTQRLAKQRQQMRAKKSAPSAFKQKQYKKRAVRPVITKKATRSAAPKAAAKRKMRSTRTTRGKPKSAMRRGASAPGQAPVAKSMAPPAPKAAARAPVRRSFNYRATAPSAGASPGAGAPADSEMSPPPPVASTAPPTSATPPASAPPPASNKNHTIVKVYFATDRQRTASTKLASLFGGQPSEPRRISYGICEVSIPKGHKPGALEAPSIWRFEFKEDPDKHVVLLKIHAQEKQTYFRNLKDIIDRSKGQNAFIFIHGYNVTFTDAARRTAQITYDLGFDGAPVFYSWPSTGDLGGYPTDEDNVAWAQENVKLFLRDFVEKTDAKNIYLVAHSMGTRALTGAVASLVAEEPQFKKRFKEIILAAPDISARIFKDIIAPKMIEASNNITLYVSGDDKALLASRKFHANPRAGEAGKNLIIYKGIDTVDATGIDSSLLAHSYFAEAKSIIADILSIIKGERASGRKALTKVQTERGAYWSFTK